MGVVAVRLLHAWVRSAVYLDGPASPDLPARVYSTGTEFRWLRPITECLMADVGVGVGVYSDFEADTSEALRITGRGLGIYKWNEQTTFVAGVLYLDRDDLKYLPAGGLIWTPTDNWHFDLLFPIPKASWRVYATPESEWWVFVAGEFSNETFAFERSDLVYDQLSIKDMRAFAGVEMKRDGGSGLRLEAGYVFDRSVEFRSLSPDLQLEDTYMVRGVVAY